MQDFRPKNKAYSNLLTRPRPIKEIDLVSYIASSDGFEAFIHREVLSQIYGDAERAAPDETIGLLAGRVWRDELGPYTLVLGVEGASKDEIDATPSHVRISGYGLSQVRQRLETNYPSMEIVGWYHSHPKFRAQFSSVDEMEQSTWSDPHHIGIVYSGLPDGPPYGVYRGPDAAMMKPRKALHPEDAQYNTLTRNTNQLNPAAVDAHKRGFPEIGVYGEVPPDSVPDANRVLGATTYSLPIKSAGRRWTVNLIWWVIGLGFLGAVTSVTLISHRINAVENQVVQLIQAVKHMSEVKQPPIAAATPIPSETPQNLRTQDTDSNAPIRHKAEILPSPQDDERNIPKGEQQPDNRKAPHLKSKR